MKMSEGTEKAEKEYQNGFLEDHQAQKCGCQTKHCKSIKSSCQKSKKNVLERKAKYLNRLMPKYLDRSI